MNISNQIKYDIIKAEKNKKVSYFASSDNAALTLDITGTCAKGKIMFYDTDNGRYLSFLKMERTNPVITCSVFGINYFNNATIIPISYIYGDDIKISSNYVIGFNFCCNKDFIPKIMINWIAIGLGSIEQINL